MTALHVPLIIELVIRLWYLRPAEQALSPTQEETFLRDASIVKYLVVAARFISMVISSSLMQEVRVACKSFKCYRTRECRDRLISEGKKETGVCRGEKM